MDSKAPSLRWLNDVGEVSFVGFTREDGVLRPQTGMIGENLLRKSRSYSVVSSKAGLKPGIFP